MEKEIDHRKTIPDAHLKSICRYRQGKPTCKYIMFNKGNFYCVKNVDFISSEINKLKDMKAKGDNCRGL